MSQFPSRKFPKSKKKIQSRGFAKGTAKIPSQKPSKAPKAQSDKSVAPVLPDRPTNESERQKRIAALKEQLKSLEDAE